MMLLDECKQSLNANKIDVKNLSPGNYLLKIEFESKIKTYKFIKK